MLGQRIAKVTTILIQLIVCSFLRGVSCESRFGILGKANNHWNKAHTHIGLSRPRSSHRRDDVLIDNADADADADDDDANDDRLEKILQEVVTRENQYLSKNSALPSTRSLGRRRKNSHQSYERTQLNPRSSSSTMMVSLEQQIQQQQNTNSDVPSTMMNESLWPPWPFNLIIKRKSQTSNNPSLSNDRQNGIGDNQSGAQLFFTYLQQKARGGFQQMQQMGNALSFHLPPAAPPLLLLAILPTKLKPLEVVDAAAGMQITSHLPNRIAKTLSLISLGTAVVCWADYEVRKKKRLTPIPLFFSSTRTSGTGTHQYRDIRKVILPPFLPPPLPPIELDPVLGNMNPNDEGSNIEQVTAIANDDKLQDFFDSDGNFDMNIPRLKRSIDKILPKPERFSLTIRSWQKMMRIKQRDDVELKRRKILDRLLVLQQLKKQEREKHGLLQKSKMLITAHGLGQGIMNGNFGTVSDSNVTAIGSNGGIGQRESPLGYALVTGASRGIGRALAVELARWDIPLILVARDQERLLGVANEIKAAYGVDCCVIPADLSEAGTAKKVHQATADAGLKVDLLINNAGVYSTGDLVDGDEQDFRNMINVNIGSVTDLSYFYGKDMKRQRRGRILFVSSVVGATPGGAGVAAYAATKAYEKSLAQSMGRELERYGVGVTCIMPGAVKDTSFASGSTGEAACWKFPFYPMNSQNIAERSIRALLSGDSEVIPGWHNRVFLKILSPLIPQRLTSSVVGFSFSPLKVGIPTLPWKRINSESDPMSMENMLFMDKSSRKKPPLVLKLPKLEQAYNTPQVPMPKDVEDTVCDKENAEEGVPEMNTDIEKLQSESTGELLNKDLEDNTTSNEAMN
jgi:short-subunit dehydrogenase